MVNETKINCPQCDFEKCDTLAILDNKVQKTILYRCLKCKYQFEESPKKNSNFRKFFEKKSIGGT